VARIGLSAKVGTMVVTKKNSVGQYVLGKTIGEGTFGKVKLGTHISTGEKVAVKILERERIKEVADVERVAREIHILKIIQHPHIIKLYEIIETPEQLFLIMEYCNGGELFDHIVECGRVPEARACKFLQQLIAGVEQIHKINVVHRDLKPENLLLDENSNIKIVDFGLSNIFKDGDLLKTACGSPCYAAPEMIAGHKYTPYNCDVWSCGVILFALVCGYLPFEDQNTSALYTKILKADYQMPKFISSEVRHLIDRMLTVDPEKRITISGIYEHPWYSQIPLAVSRWGPSPPPSPSAATGRDDAAEADDDVEGIPLVEDVLEQMVKLGFAREHTVDCLRTNQHNSTTTTYYLLVEKKRRVECPSAEVQDTSTDSGNSSSSTRPPADRSQPKPQKSSAAQKEQSRKAGKGDQKKGKPDSKGRSAAKATKGDAQGSKGSGKGGNAERSGKGGKAQKEATKAAKGSKQRGNVERQQREHYGQSWRDDGYPSDSWWADGYSGTSWDGSWTGAGNQWSSADWSGWSGWSTRGW